MLAAGVASVLLVVVGAAAVADRTTRLDIGLAVVMQLLLLGVVALTGLFGRRPPLAVWRVPAWQ